MAKISVIIAVYNVEKYLSRCLDSVVSQTLTDLEIICVNDASTDSCGTVLAEYARRDPRIRILTRTRHIGPSSRNAGLDVFTGDYVMFVDSDDWIPPYAAQGFLAVAEASGAPVVASASYGVNTLPPGPPTSFPWKIRRPALKHLVRSPKIQSSVWNKCYRADVVRTRRFIEGIFFEDWPFLTELFGNLGFFALLETPMYVYCINDGASSVVHSSFTRHKVESYMRGIEFVSDRFKSHPMAKWAHERINTAQRMMIGKIYKSPPADREHLFGRYVQLSHGRLPGLRDVGFKTWYRLRKMSRGGTYVPSDGQTNP